MNNIKNTICPKKEIEKIIKKYTQDEIFISMLNYKYYINSFMHKSFNCNFMYNDDTDNNCNFLLHNYVTLNGENYERLEYLGDAQIYAIIAEYLYNKYPDKDEGFMTKLRIKLIKKEQLAYLCKKLNFEKYVLLSCHLDTNYSRFTNKSLLENVFESFIGALYKDQGFEITKKFLTNILEEHIDFNKLIVEDTDFKSKLLLLFHSQSWNYPEYTLLFKTGEFTQRVVYCCIKLNKKNISNNKHNYEFKKLTNKTINYITKNCINHDYTFDENYYYLFVSYHKTKKQAEQECSKNCFNYLKQNFFTSIN